MPEVRVIPPIAEEAKQIRVAAYARVSSGSEGQLGSFAVQVAYYTRLIQQNKGWIFAGVYADEAVTGTRADRRGGFQQLMQDCRTGKVDRILTKSISRFARNTLDCIQAVRELQALGVSVEFEKESIDTGKMGGEMLLSMLGAAAQEESISISKNLKWAVRKRMQAGEFIAGSAPFGYRLVGGALQPDPEEAPIVQEVFSRYLAGESPTEIARGLNHAGAATRGEPGPQWGYSAIRYILSNEKYMGDSLLQKRFTTDTFPYRAIPNTGQAPQYYIPNSHQGIVPRETFEAAQKLLKERKELNASVKGQSPFSQKLYCGLCGSALHRHNGGWACYRHWQDASACPLKAIASLEIQEAFLSLYNKLLANPGILETALAQLQQLQSRAMQAQPDIARLSREIASLAKQNHTLARLQSKGSLDPALFHGRLNANNQKLAQLQGALQQAQGSGSAGQLEGMAQGTKRLLAFLKGSSMMAGFEPEAFRQTVSKITAWPDRFQFHLANSLVLEERRD